MKQIIKSVLDCYKDQQINLGSDSARENIALEICEALIENGTYTKDSEMDKQVAREKEKWVCSICGKNTYNVEYEDDHVSEDIPNTISLHRKKQSNTLYTINALNEVIRELNDGVLDKRFPIPWEDYQNSLLLTNDAGLNKIPTKIHTIINIKEREKD